MDERIKRMTTGLLCIILLIFVGVIAGTAYLFNTIFPKAEPINVPEPKSVVSVSLSCSTSGQTAALGEEDVEQLLQYLREGKPTRQRAMSDYPTERIYYGISVQTEVREYLYFVYEKEKHIYIEVPYEGIYETQAQLLDLVLTYHQGT